MSVDTKRLRELAEKATPGPWFVSENDGSICAEPEAGRHVEVGPVDFGSADFAYVVAANPQMVIGLLKELETHRRTLDEIAAFACGPMRNEGMGARQIVDNIRDNHRRELTAVVVERDRAEKALRETQGELDNLSAAYGSAREDINEAGQDIEDLEAQLAAMTAARDEACDLAVDACDLKWDSDKKKTRERIAELRKAGQ